MRELLRKPIWPLVALLLLNLAVTPSFFAVRVQDGRLYGSLIDILHNGAPLALTALGMTLVIATRGIDLSVGAVVAIAGAVTCTWIAGSPDPASPGAALAGIGLALGLAVALGAWNGFLVARLGIQPIIATLVLMTAGRGLAQLVTDGQIVTVNNDTFSGISGSALLTVPVTVIVAAAVYALVALVTRRTALGTLVEAVGINPEASRLAGVRSRTIVWTVYVFCALCAAVAGLMISSNVHAADANNAGLWLELDAILAVVIGGTSLAGGRYSIAGTLLGALTIQTLTTTIYSVGIPPEVSLVFKAVVVILVFLAQAPRVQALLTRRGRRGAPPPAAPPAAAVEPAPAATEPTGSSR
ncbi:monosaccharide ABC transporter membrane protein (CUT2 family) [Pseudonocardia hierapolitana]|uniref:Monosaccharide ABC transporter membrane protein (CUT2 family) n=1 Tax=Pseudonocardia hierapolitana TaxID=1128676 RepID=A0A561T445_9PSEU|nr:ABC transporter permease [Pseudonocardia hierapolitana]TWF81883.1 monosaccharide ABC transporter membrane protein (CUT2 family) [Pseudonocardia hierapolitana]